MALEGQTEFTGVTRGLMDSARIQNVQYYFPPKKWAEKMLETFDETLKQNCPLTITVQSPSRPVTYIF